MSDTNPLKTAEEVEYGNNYAEGTIEWHAWGDGNTYAEATDLPSYNRNEGERDSPLSGEFSDDPQPAQVILNAWRHIFGESWTAADTDDFFAKADDEDQELTDAAILEAWVTGYHNYYADKYGDDDNNAESE